MSGIRKQTAGDKKLSAHYLARRSSHVSFRKIIKKAVRVTADILKRQLLLRFTPVSPSLPRKRTNRRPVADPLLTAAWHKLRQEYFPQYEIVDTYIVRWSTRRQKRTLGSCNIKRKTVTVASELDCEECNRWIIPLLYHEMCHAVLGETIRLKGRRTPWHGAEFKKLEKRHPGMKELTDWMKQGGWRKAVRSARGRQVWQERKSQTR